MRVGQDRPGLSQAVTSSSSLSPHTDGHTLILGILQSQSSGLSSMALWGTWECSPWEAFQLVSEAFKTGSSRCLKPATLLPALLGGRCPEVYVVVPASCVLVLSTQSPVLSPMVSLISTPLCLGLSGGNTLVLFRVFKRSTRLPGLPFSSPLPRYSSRLFCGSSQSGSCSAS